MVSEDRWLRGHGAGLETREDCDGSAQRHIALRTKVRAELAYNQNPSPANTQRFSEAKERVNRAR